MYSFTLHNFEHVMVSKIKQNLHSHFKTERICYEQLASHAVLQWSAGDALCR